MYYLFSEAPAQINLKVKDTDFREYYPAIALEMSWNNLRPYIRQAYYSNLLPFIGKDLYNALVLNLTASTPDADKTELTVLIKQALALHAINLGYPELNSHISDGAVTQVLPQGATSVSQWAFNAARWNTILKAEKSLDLAISFIIENEITPWTAGDDYKSTWIHSAKELTKYIKVNGHRAYMAMLPYFKYAEQNIKNEISCEVYADILTNIEDPDYVGVIDHIKSYIAHYTLAETMPRMLTFVEGDSLLFIHNAEGITNGTGVYSKPNLEAIEMLRVASLKNASTDMQNICTTLAKDATTFPLYATYLDSIKTNKAILISPCGVGGIMLT